MVFPVVFYIESGQIIFTEFPQRIGHQVIINFFEFIV